MPIQLYPNNMSAARLDSGCGVLHFWRPCCGVCVPFPSSASLACRAPSSGRRPARCISFLPFQPAINLGTSNRNRFISRSLKSGGCGLSASGIRNHHGPVIAAGTCKNQKINAFVVHPNETLQRLNERHRVKAKKIAAAARAIGSRRKIQRRRRSSVRPKRTGAGDDGQELHDLTGDIPPRSAHRHIYRASPGVACIE
jgi:hypothetical protein